MQQSFYSEKEMLADALTAEKTATTLYNTFSNECVHENVRGAILDCLQKEHAIQNQVFNMMHDRGYYPTPSAETQKVDEAKQKFRPVYAEFPVSQRDPNRGVPRHNFGMASVFE